MPLGIRPTNDFAFKKTFGTPENKPSLASLLNSILDLKRPIVDLTLQNPYNLQDFQNDKLSILDIKAVDQFGAVYGIEMQLEVVKALVQRTVFYGCELYAGQMVSGQDYDQIRPVYSICLLDGILWPDAVDVQHVFRLADLKSGRVLEETLQIHTLELGRYNLREADLPTASLLDCWLYWFLHAHEYEAEALLKLLPYQPIQQATRTIESIALITEDKAMYESREKARRDEGWIARAAYREGERDGEIKGEIKGKIETIRILENLLGGSTQPDTELQTMTLEQLEAHTRDLQEKLRNRN